AVAARAAHRERGDRGRGGGGGLSSREARRRRALGDAPMSRRAAWLVFSLSVFSVRRSLSVCGRRCGRGGVSGSAAPLCGSSLLLVCVRGRRGRGGGGGPAWPRSRAGRS